MSLMPISSSSSFSSSLTSISSASSTPMSKGALKGRACSVDECKKLTTKKCSACKIKFYCSQDCQKIDREDHRNECNIISSSKAKSLSGQKAQAEKKGDGLKKMTGQSITQNIIKTVKRMRNSLDIPGVFIVSNYIAQEKCEEAVKIFNGKTRHKIKVSQAVEKMFGDFQNGTKLSKELHREAVDRWLPEGRGSFKIDVSNELKFKIIDTYKLGGLLYDKGILKFDNEEKIEVKTVKVKAIKVKLEGSREGGNSPLYGESDLAHELTSKEKFMAWMAFNKPISLGFILKSNLKTKKWAELAPGSLCVISGEALSKWMYVVSCKVEAYYCCIQSQQD